MSLEVGKEYYYPYYLQPKPEDANKPNLKSAHIAKIIGIEASPKGWDGFSFYEYLIIDRDGGEYIAKTFDDGGFIEINDTSTRYFNRYEEIDKMVTTENLVPEGWVTAREELQQCNRKLK